jgi:homoserine O-acetyltransferase/O-succinyltransferase
VQDYEIFESPELHLQGGTTLPTARLAYKTYGSLNRDGDNVIVYPTWYGGQHSSNEWLIGAGRALDPDRYFIVVPNMLGNGLSSSPSNTPEPWARSGFPAISIYDNVVFQHRLLTERLGARRIALAVGWSMGAQQAFQWGASFPDMVERIAPFCGSAKTSRHNFVFLEGVKAALTADAAFEGGRYETKPSKGLRAMARVYAGWGFSQAFYREQCDIKSLGFKSLEDFLVNFWENLFNKDANDLLAMLATWQAADISRGSDFNGDINAALKAIRARALVMPSKTDLYFTPEDSETEVAQMPNAVLKIIPSIWGHSAGGPGLNPLDVAFIDAALKELLRSS